MTTPFDIVTWSQKVHKLAVDSDTLDEGDAALDAATLKGADLVIEFVKTLGNYHVATSVINAISGNGSAALSMLWPQERIEHILGEAVKAWREDSFLATLRYGYTGDADDEETFQAEMREQLAEQVGSAQQHYNELAAKTQ